MNYCTLHEVRANEFKLTIYTDYYFEIRRTSFGRN